MKKRTVKINHKRYCGCLLLLVTVFLHGSPAVIAEQDANSADAVLGQLNQKTAGLISLQGRIEYLFSQPLLDSQTLRKGVLYYGKTGNSSALRISFQTLQQDQEKEQKRQEEYIFDGVWLTYIDYRLKTARRYQQTEPDSPMDALKLAGRNFPIIGLTGAEDLKKDFEVALTAQSAVEEKNLVHLCLKPRTDSAYRGRYASIDFWMDSKTALASKIIAVSDEGDIYQIKFSQLQTGKKPDSKIFEVEIPKDFNTETMPLNRPKDERPKAKE